MTKVNLLPSLGEGFRLIIRHPGSVLVWGLISLAAAFIPMLIYWAFVGPDMLTFYGELANSADSGQTPAPPTLSAGAYLTQLLQYVLAPVSGGLVYAGIYRAVLRPEEGGFGHVRLGMDEVNVGIVLVVMAVLFIAVSLLAGIVVFIPLFIGVAIAAAAGGAVAMAIILPLAMIALLAFLVFLYARFGMAIPMTFAEKRIRIFEAWTFTKGYSGQLVAMAFIQLAVIVVLYISVGLAIVAAAAGAMTDFGAVLDPAALEPLFQNPDALFQRFLPFFVVGGVLYLIACFVVQPIFLAPWARAYQMITMDRLALQAAETFTETP